MPGLGCNTPWLSKNSPSCYHYSKWDQNLEDCQNFSYRLLPDYKNVLTEELKEVIKSMYKQYDFDELLSLVLEQQIVDIICYMQLNDLSNSRSILAEILTLPDSTSSVRQRYKYNKEQLVAISKTAGAKSRPHFLQLEFFNDNGVWDPEKWVLNERNDDGISQKSSSEEPKPKRERPADLDKESVTGKRRYADPKERLKEEQDGIVLSPQRRSFGTGCHVTQQVTTVPRRSESPPDLRANDRDNHREPSRRIGSGRFFNRDRERDREREREREYGYRNNDRRDHDRDVVRGRGERERGERDRFRRDERDLRSHRELNSKEREFDRRGSKDKGFRRIDEEEEPEWFSGGPTSQHETIELRGFDELNEDDDSRGKAGSKRERRKSWRKPKTPSIEDIAERSEEGSEPSDIKSQNGVESNAETATTDTAQADGDTEETTHSGFDFGDLFKFDTMPGMFPVAPALSPETIESALSGSRFGQFFRRETSPTQNNSTDTSRRSSFQDELITPIIGTLSEQNDLVSSPTSGSDKYFTPISPAKITKSSSEGGKQLLDIIKPNRDDLLFTENANSGSVSKPDRNKDLQKMETSLKNLVLGNSNINHQGSQDESGSTAFQHSSNGNMNAFQKLISQITDGRATPAHRSGNVLNYENEEKKIFKESELHGSNQSKMHIMNVLKHAPTEEDILNGYLNGNSDSSRPENTSSPQKPHDFLSLFANPANQGCPLPESIPSIDSLMLMNSLNKTQNPNQGLPLPNNSAFSYGAVDRLQKQPSPVNSNMKKNIRQNQTCTMSSQQPPTNSIQQQQREILAAILKQQQQQQQQVGPVRQPSPVHPPAIQHPCASPHSHTLNGPISPRSLSPHHDIQHSFMHHQRQNIPSPLMFRQDPPPISHAPSPIHPGHIVQPIATVAPLNPNTLQVQTGHILARVPSPQELRAHTQQIMQNALIKKKLEEQKENYRKRQEQQESQSSSLNKFIEAGAKSTPGLSPSLSIIPTSVMRKMQAGKEKDASKINSVNTPQPQQNPLHTLAQMVPDCKINSLLSQTSGALLSSELEKLQKNQLQRSGLGQNYSNGPNVGRGPINIPTTANTNVASNIPIQGRRIVKSNQSGQQPQQQRVMTNSQMLSNQNKAYLATPGNIDLTKQYIQQQAAVAAATAQRQLNISPMSGLGHPGIPIRGTNNLHNAAVNPVRPPVNLTSNNFLMRNIVHPAPALTQFNQVAAYQRSVDPRQLQPKSSQQFVQPPNLHSLTMSNLLMGVGGNARNAVPMNSRPIQGSNQSVNALLGKNDPVSCLNSTGTSGMSPQTLNFLKSVNSSKSGSNTSQMGATMNEYGHLTGGRESPSSINFNKWFGSDLKMPNLPPVPIQKAQYVEEVEQRQQHPTTVQN